jgi:hypothetical protein
MLRRRDEGARAQGERKSPGEQPQADDAKQDGQETRFLHAMHPATIRRAPGCVAN